MDHPKLGTSHRDSDTTQQAAASPAPHPTSARPAVPTPVPGLLPDTPRQGGYGPATDKPYRHRPYTHPSAGWGAAKSVGKVLLEQRTIASGAKAMFEMNHAVRAYDCPGCAWPDDTGDLRLDICENGIKHVTWEMTSKRAGPKFFAEHTVSELSSWSDFALEDVGRLTHPMSYDPDTDRYVPISWTGAFTMIGQALRSLDSPDRAAFYTSGRLSNEASFLYQLFAREYGTNNLPDCSNMCHEASGRALTASIGSGKGTCDLDDWGQCDALFVMGVNAASNAPRMLTSLAEAHRRGAQIVHVNPLVEAASTRTIVPHDFVEMGLNRSTATGTMDVQVRPGGDLALLRGMAKVVLEAARTDPSVLDQEFLDTHARGFEDYRAIVEATEWADLEHQAGLSEDAIRRAARVYLESERTVISWCLGLTQHEHGVDTVREIVNLLALRGNIGRPGAGPSPIRGHSNVQGNRTCGINHNPTPALLDRLAEVCQIDPPRHRGFDTVATCAAMNDGQVSVFVSLGGNFVLAAPDTRYTAAGLNQCDLTVQVSTKLNRSHLVHGKQALILPCLGRTEVDRQVGGEQGVSLEDAMSMVHLSVGRRRPASPYLMSEPAILCRMARATLPDSVTPWEAYTDDYDQIRDVMAQVLPGFEGFNQLVRQPHGFRIPQPARQREWLTPSGRLELSLADLPDVVPDDPEVLVLQTMRSHDQWNTTIYSNDDRYRGVSNLRELIFLNIDDMRDRGIANDSTVDITATSRDGSQRVARGFRALAHDLPRGSAAGYFPELNVLVGWSDHSTQSDQPISKAVRVRVVPTST